LENVYQLAAAPCCAYVNWDAILKNVLEGPREHQNMGVVIQTQNTEIGDTAKNTDKKAE